MTTTTRNITAALLAFALAAPVVANAATNTADKAKAKTTLDDLFGDPVVAKGSGIEIKRSQLDNVMVNVRLMVSQQAQQTGQPVSADRMMLFEREALDELIFLAITLNKATAADKAKAKEMFNAELAKYKKQFNLTDEQFEEQQSRMLRVQGITKEQWEKQSMDSQIKLAVIERELGINITDADKKKFYDENPSEFQVPESVRVAHILLSTKDPQDNTANPALKRDLPEDKKKEKRAQAEAILKRAKAGEDFTKLATELSEDPGVKQNKGEYQFGRNDAFVEEFKTASFALATNQISDIVTTLFGYHIIKQLEHTPARKIPLDEIAPRIGDYLKNQQLREKAPALYQKLATEAKVEVLDEKLKAIERTPSAPKAGEKK